MDPNYLGDDRDMTTMGQGLHRAREIGQAHALDGWRAREAQPGPEVDDDFAWRTSVRGTVASYTHPVGTCRMGADDLAVVDTRLRVRGVDGLRVADGSVMPALPSANTNATVHAVAERSADTLRPGVLETAGASGVTRVTGVTEAL